MAEPTASEQYMLELINRARQNPTAEAERYSLDLNQGLAPDTISIDPKQPLAFNPLLIEASRAHSQWMLDNNTFSHTGIEGSNAGDRIRDAGYEFTGSWSWGENLALTQGISDVDASVSGQHQSLFESPGHRNNIFKDSYREIGIGTLNDSFNGIEAVASTHNFASSGSAVFLTGVAFNDSVVDDDFYTIGEGLGGITVEATRNSDNQVFTTTTMTAGGYQIALESGTYTVEFSQNGILYGSEIITINDQNVKVDLLEETLLTTTEGIAEEIIVSDSGNVDEITGLVNSNVVLDDGEVNILIGVDPSSENPGLGEIDVLTGNFGKDVFVLGDGNQAYYNDGDDNNLGRQDYAVLENFNPEEDLIRLHGNLDDYGFYKIGQGTVILLETANQYEGIGLVEGVDLVSGANRTLIELDTNPGFLEFV